jgi:hypothetical protein
MIGSKEEHRVSLIVKNQIDLLFNSALAHNTYARLAQRCKIPPPPSENTRNNFLARHPRPLSLEVWPETWRLRYGPILWAVHALFFSQTPSFLQRRGGNSDYIERQRNETTYIRRPVPGFGMSRHVMHWSASLRRWWRRTAASAHNWPHRCCHAIDDVECLALKSPAWHNTCRQK